MHEFLRNLIICYRQFDQLLVSSSVRFSLKVRGNLYSNWKKIEKIPVDISFFSWRLMGLCIPCLTWLIESRNLHQVFFITGFVPSLSLLLSLSRTLWQEWWSILNDTPTFAVFSHHQLSGFLRSFLRSHPTSSMYWHPITISSSFVSTCLPSLLLLKEPVGCKIT